MREKLAELYPGESFEWNDYAGQLSVMLPVDLLVSVVTSLQQSLSFDFLVDLTAVDYPERAERFDLIYVLYNFGTNTRLRVKTRLTDGAPAPSLTQLFKSANWMEREVFDMFGISFTGHPNLRRILLPDEWRGFPLRKDYSIIQQDQAWVQANLGIESGQ